MHSNRLTMIAVLVLSMTVVCAEDGVIEPFNGKDLSGWKFKGNNAAAAKVKVGKASLDPNNPKLFVVSEGNELINVERGVDFYSEAKHGDAVIELELMVPKGSNSGVYVMGEYEVQVLDSFGVAKPGTGDIGALYGAAPPMVNAAKAPGEWQKFVIDFRAPKFDGQGKKIANAKFVKIELNGKTIQENVEMKGPTPAGLTGKEAPTGPIMFQGDHGPVSFRNIKITPVK
ncbi:MAG TPA: DUF1080 domain-containing protein [Planctomycetota bacterium]|nr:DUF1080 domain-containing protein [Planctomycetota bacterium]